MVYFECQKCNETVKKPKLAKHLQCCGSFYVSCIDCSKVFRWDEWEAHTTCMSEAQKYQGNLYNAKENVNKGQVKQDAWIEGITKMVEDPNSTINPTTKSLLQRLLGFDNIPRKQKPFGNFVKNSLKLWNDKQIADMWAVIEVVNAAAKASADKARAEAEAAKKAAKEEAAAKEAAATAKEELKTVKKAQSEYMSEFKAATGAVEDATAALTFFKEGALEAFEALKERNEEWEPPPKKVKVAEEEAPAEEPAVEAETVPAETVPEAVAS